MKRRITVDRSAALLLIVLLLLSLTACGAKNNEISPPAEIPETVPVEEERETATPADNGAPKFPAFEGRDLDGNAVKSDELFSGSAVTVVNFWFTTCGPCVGELDELDALNKELADKGGRLIGINVFTLNGDETAISEAKDVLATQGAGYQNVYFDLDSDAGRFASGIYAYPTTFVVDRGGRIVGDPIVGAITARAQADALRDLIDRALAADAS